MDIRIGIQNLPREISFESSADPKALAAEIKTAIDAGDSSIDLTDDKGRHVIVPVAAIGYVEIGPEESRRIGFGS